MLLPKVSGAGARNEFPPITISDIMVRCFHRIGTKDGDASSAQSPPKGYPVQGRHCQLGMVHADSYQTPSG